MAFPQDKGQKNKVHNTGEAIFGTDGTNFYPTLGSTAGIASGAGTTVRLIIAQREPFIFRPGAAALGSGMVAAGTRSAAGTTTSGTVASSTYWSAWHSYAPLRSGQIDGLSSGGIVSGQLTIGIKTGAGTGTAALIARMANTANTSAPTTVLALTGTMSCTTAEIFQTYDIPYLLTDTTFNAIPFSVAIGAQHNQGGSTVVFRIMESSYVQGEYEPGT